MDDTANGDATATAPATVAHSDSNTQPVIAEFSRVLDAVPLATVPDVAAAVAAADAVPDPSDSAFDGQVVQDNSGHANAFATVESSDRASPGAAAT